MVGVADAVGRIQSNYKALIHLPLSTSNIVKHHNTHNIATTSVSEGYGGPHIEPAELEVLAPANGEGYQPRRRQL